MSVILFIKKIVIINLEPNDCLDNKRYKYIGPGSLFIQNSVHVY